LTICISAKAGPGQRPGKLLLKSVDCLPGGERWGKNLYHGRCVRLGGHIQVPEVHEALESVSKK